METTATTYKSFSIDAILTNEGHCGSLTQASAEKKRTEFRRSHSDELSPEDQIQDDHSNLDCRRSSPDNMDPRVAMVTAGRVPYSALLKAGSRSVGTVNPQPVTQETLPLYLSTPGLAQLPITASYPYVSVTSGHALNFPHHSPYFLQQMALLQSRSQQPPRAQSRSPLPSREASLSPSGSATSGHSPQMKDHGVLRRDVTPDDKHYPTAFNAPEGNNLRLPSSDSPWTRFTVSRTRPRSRDRTTTSNRGSDPEEFIDVESLSGSPGGWQDHPALYSLKGE